MAFCSTFLGQVARSYYQCNVKLWYHPPEIFTGVRQRTLRCNNFRISLLQWTVNEVGIDVSLYFWRVSFPFLFWTLLELNSGVFKWKNISIAILILIFLICIEHLVLDFSVRACHKPHEFLIYVNFLLFPLTQWKCCIKVSWILVLNLLPQLVWDVFIFDVFAFDRDLFRINYEMDSQNRLYTTYL